jgi:hypothetical protein
MGLKVNEKIGSWDLPYSIRNFFDSLRIVNRFRYQKEFKKYHNKMDRLKNRYSDRIFILGNGPSLNKTNLSLLKNEWVFAVNAFYTGLNLLGKTPEFWALSDESGLKTFGDEILKLDTLFFLSGDAGIYYFKHKERYTKYKEPVVIKRLRRINYSDSFSYDLKKGVNGGKTVISDIAIPVSLWLGFSELYLLGCDCDYSGSQHFDGRVHNYRDGKPEMMKSEIGLKRVFDSYKICRKVIESEGKKIINCTVGGKLEVFDRMKLEDIINV